jgi:hypothetical protein
MESDSGLDRSRCSLAVVPMNVSKAPRTASACLRLRNHRELYIVQLAGDDTDAGNDPEQHV